MFILIFLLSFFGLFLLFSIVIYNTIVKKANQVDNALGSIDAMLKKRYDLIPNLVNVVKQYMKHEKEVLTGLTELRTKALSADIDKDERIDLENKISKGVGGIMVAVENYPELKSDATFLQLQGAWNETEGQIAASRRFFNAAVTAYNDTIETFPNSMIASMSGYHTMQVFVIPEEQKLNLSAKELFDN